MEVQITSLELVKPSSPTPPHLRTFKLSLLDQVVPFPYAPIILFYPADSEPAGDLSDVRRKVDLLKKSLSRTLARFYPLAGKIRDGLCVDCDDGGARFLEASVSVSLAQFLSDPDLVLLNKLVPYVPLDSVSLDLTHTANVQISSDILLCLLQRDYLHITTKSML